VSHARLVTVLAGTLAFAAPTVATAQKTKLKDPRLLADKALLVAGPTEAFRYNQGTSPYGRSTRTLLARGRPASDQGVEGGATWRVPDVPEGRDFLAARFFSPEDRLLETRSEVVFLAPEYPSLRNAAEDALERLRGRAEALDVVQREVSLPSTEMLVEDAVMRWEDFGHAPRDGDYIRTRLETAAEYADRLTSGGDPWHQRRALAPHGRDEAERLADSGPDVRARWTVLPDTAVTPELMATHNLVLVGGGTANGIVGQIEAQLPVRHDAGGTHVGGRRVAGPESAFRVQSPNPGRLVVVYGGNPDVLARAFPGSASRRRSLAGEYVVVDARGEPALQGYFRDDHTIAVPSDE
jgi:hypothetical protein